MAGVTWRCTKPIFEAFRAVELNVSLGTTHPTLCWSPGPLPTVGHGIGCTARMLGQTLNHCFELLYLLPSWFEVLKSQKCKGFTLCMQYMWKWITRSLPWICSLDGERKNVLSKVYLGFFGVAAILTHAKAWDLVLWKMSQAFHDPSFSQSALSFYTSTLKTTEICLYLDSDVWVGCFTIILVVSFHYFKSVSCRIVFCENVAGVPQPFDQLSIASREDKHV